MNIKTGTRTMFSLLILLCSTTTLAQALHLIVVADSADLTIGQGARSNSVEVAGFFQEAGRVLGVPTDVTRVDGEQTCAATNSCFSCASILRALDAPNIGANDTVVFYYSGHGFRDAGQPSTMPSLYCNTSTAAADEMTLDSVAQTLQSKHPRLLVVVADACNVVVPRIAVPKPAAFPPPPPPARLPILRTLILGHRGTLLFSSSIPGQYSWYYPYGGVFTNQLIAALNSVSSPTGSGLWDDVVQDAIVNIKIQGLPGPPITQQPQAIKQGLAKI